MRRADCNVYYDKPNERLVYVGRPPDEFYWDSHWEKSADPSMVKTPNRFVTQTTLRRLPRGARVLDAGCGLARTVFGLHRAGYEAYGIDFAPKTVALVNRLAPELKVRVSDVRELDFEDNFFDGVWSLGVIEHFYDGYEVILTEMHRVLKSGGLAFLTVPSMSPLRRLKAALGAYAPLADVDLSEFYQFILPPPRIIADFETLGFRLVSSTPRGGFKGLKDELGFLRAPLQTLYDSKLKPLRALRAMIDKAIGPISFHTRLYIFRRI